MFAIWRRSDLIHFSGLGLSRALLPDFLQVFDSFSICLVFFSLGKSANLIILGAWAFLGRMGRPVVWKQCFSWIFISKSMVFGLSGVPLDDIFRSLGILGQLF